MIVLASLFDGLIMLWSIMGGVLTSHPERALQCMENQWRKRGEGKNSLKNTYYG
jgi:hypothetical protein